MSQPLDVLPVNVLAVGLPVESCPVVLPVENRVPTSVGALVGRECAALHPLPDDVGRDAEAACDLREGDAVLLHRPTRCPGRPGGIRPARVPPECTYVNRIAGRTRTDKVDMAVQPAQKNAERAVEEEALG